MSDKNLYSHYLAFEEHADEYYGEEVDLDDLFDPEFMERRTEFDEITAFLEEAPVDVEEPSDFEGLTFGDLDGFVEEHSQFDNFAGMFASAVRRWTRRHSHDLGDALPLEGLPDNQRPAR